MDSIKNPFSPGAGSPPPELAGRAEVLDAARVLFGRLLAHRSEKGLLMTGLRGVGKTVLLNEMEQIAQSLRCKTVLLEAYEDKSLALLLVPHLRKVLFDLNRMAGVGDKVRRSMAVLRSFIGGVKLSLGDAEFGLDISAEPGSADSGDLEVDLPNLFVAVGEAAEERKTAFILLIDEIQYFQANELSALIMAMHKMQQRQLPVTLVGAGLPILPGLAGQSKSYAERLFAFPEIGPLSPSESRSALRDPVRQSSVDFSDQALDEIVRMTQGYPYFLQEWGYQTWNLATSSPIEIDVVKRSHSLVAARLDQNFFRVRFDRLTPREKEFLRAMAENGPGPYRTADIAAALGVKITSLGPLRAKLIQKGMIYSPAHGDMGFTVPLFDEFLRRVMPY